MIWVVDKKVVVHLAEYGGRLAEVPLRVSFEYAVEAGALVAGSLSIDVLYNDESVCRYFPGLDKNELDGDIKKTAGSAVREHLALSGVASVSSEELAVAITPH